MIPAMPSPRRKKNQRATNDMPMLEPRHSLTYEAVQALDGPTLDAAKAAVSRSAELLGEGGNALGGLARAGLRAVSGESVTGAVTGTARAVASTAGDALSSIDAGAVADAVTGAARAAASTAGDALATVDAGAVIGAVADVAGDVLAASGSVAGDVLAASADVAGEVLGAVVEGVADSIS
jgi:hypothetical protein